MINISKNIFVGIDSGRITQGLNEAEIAPGGDTQSEQKKIKDMPSKFSDVKEFENIPLPGFTLLESGKKTYNSLERTWLVIDPRGFLARISSDNMESILSLTGITEGLIQEKCLWVREDSRTKVKLVPINDPQYIEAVGNTKLLENKIDISTVSIGDLVYTQKEIIGTYMGRMSIYGYLGDFKYGDPTHKVIKHLRQYVIKVKGKTADYYVASTKPNILEIREKSTKLLTIEDSVTEVNNELSKRKGVFVYDHVSMNSNPYFRKDIKYVSRHAVSDVGLSLVEVTKNEVPDLFAYSVTNTNDMVCILEDAKGRKYTFDFPYLGYRVRSANYTINNFFTKPITTIEASSIEVSTNRNDETSPRFSLDNFVKFYKILKSVKHDTFL